MESPKLSEEQKAYFRAAAEGGVDDLSRSLKRGIPVDLPDAELFLLGLAWDTTALMYAAGNGHLEAVRFLLKSGANVAAKSKANKQDGGGESQALHFAVANGNLAVIEELIKAGADPNAQGNWGRTPLTIAADKGKADALKLLLKLGARADLKPARKLDLPPLYAAVAGKEVPPAVKKELVQTLVQAGADPNAVGDANQSSINRLGSVKDLPDEVRASLFEALLKAGGQVDHVDKFGGTALQGVVNSKSPKSVAVLVDAGADVNRVFKVGKLSDIAKRQVKNLESELAELSRGDEGRAELEAELRDAQAVLQLLTKPTARKSPSPQTVAKPRSKPK